MSWKLPEGAEVPPHLPPMPFAPAALRLPAVPPPPAPLSVAPGLELLVDRFLPDEEADLFNRPAFHALHRARCPGGGVLMQLRHDRSPRICGRFHALQVEPGLWSSPGRGSYGGFDLAEDLGPVETEAFIRAAEAWLLAAGARRLELVLPPLGYAPERSALTFNALARLGYGVTRHELNQAISLGRHSFSACGTYANRKRLAKAAREGVSASLLEPALHEAAYGVLLESRRKKNYSLSMSWPQVQEMLAGFPGAVHVFGAFLKGEMIAAALCVQVNPAILYVYAWGEKPGVERLSPVTVLAGRIYHFARAEGCRMLDLGTSSIQGELNQGLYAFKKSLGAAASVKLYLGKTLGWTV